MSKRDKLNGQRTQTRTSIDTVMYDGDESGGTFIASIETAVEDLMQENQNLKRQLGDKQVDLHGFQITRRGLIAPDNATEAEWLDIGDFLFNVEDGIQLLIGDYLVGIQLNHKITYEKIAESTGKSKKTLRNYKTVAGSINLSLRKDNLYFGHYNLIQGMKPKEQKYWIDRASEGDLDPETKEYVVWSVARLRNEIKMLPPVKSDSTLSAKIDRKVDGVIDGIRKQCENADDEKRMELAEIVKIQMQRFAELYHDLTTDDLG